MILMVLNEWNVVHKDWRRIKLSFALCYPNIYRVGMSCLALHLLYELLNRYEDVVCERVFFDRRLPLTSVESNIPLSRFDVLGFSLQYELDYINFVRMLLESGIPPYSVDRGPDDPLVCVGGPAVTANPLPVSAFSDFVILYSLFSASSILFSNSVNFSLSLAPNII